MLDILRLFAHFDSFWDHEEIAIVSCLIRLTINNYRRQGGRTKSYLLLGYFWKVLIREALSMDSWQYKSEFPKNSSVPFQWNW